MSDRRRVAPFVAIVLAVVLAGLFVVLLGADASSDETADTPLLDQPAPAAKGELGDGTSFDLSQRKGSWVVVNFFQSSCVPCKIEHPALVEFVDAESKRQDGADFYTIVYDDDRESVEAFFEERGGDWPVVYDDDGSIAVAFGVAKVPETWIIDPDGVVRERIISTVTADVLRRELDRFRLAG